MTPEESERGDAPASDGGADAVEALDEAVEDRTTVVDRAVADEDQNATVVVDRARHKVDDRTVVIDRAREEDGDRTVVVDRARDGDDDGTVVVDRDRTVVVRKRAGKGAKASPLGEPLKRGRRRITLPPVEPGFAPEAVDAIGVGAVVDYEPRQIQPIPPAAPKIELGPEATRAPAPSMPSVLRRSRRMSVLAVAGFWATAVISVLGLSAIVYSLFTG